MDVVEDDEHVATVGARTPPLDIFSASHPAMFNYYDPQIICPELLSPQLSLNSRVPSYYCTHDDSGPRIIHPIRTSGMYIYLFPYASCPDFSESESRQLQVFKGAKFCYVYSQCTCRVPQPQQHQIEQCKPVRKTEMSSSRFEAEVYTL